MSTSPELSDLGPARDPLVGLVLADRYRLVRRIGQGGMGAIYEGVHQIIGKRVAVKLLHPQMAGDPETVGRFLNEARAAATLAHPHICDALDVGRAPDGTPFLILEFLEGHSLSVALSRSGPLSPARAATLIRHVASALTVAHSKGIVHRDLKPDNLYLALESDGSECIKVLDFGISKIRGSNGVGTTRTGEVMGTPAFMAPEQLLDSSKADARTDIYALGVVLYQCLSGALPFESHSLAGLGDKIAHEAPEPLSQRAPGIPPALAALVHRCLEKDPALRFPSMEALSAELGGLGPLSDQPLIRLSASVPPVIPAEASSTGPSYSDATVKPSVRPSPSGSHPPPAAILQPTAAPSPSTSAAAVTAPIQPTRPWTLIVGGIGLLGLGALAASWFLRPPAAASPPVLAVAIPPAAAPPAPATAVVISPPAAPTPPPATRPAAVASAAIAPLPVASPEKPKHPKASPKLAAVPTVAVVTTVAAAAVTAVLGVLQISDLPPIELRAAHELHELHDSTGQYQVTLDCTLAGPRVSVRVSSEPWSIVSANGRTLDKTKLTPVQLPPIGADPVRVELVNPELSPGRLVLSFAPR